MVSTDMDSCFLKNFDVVGCATCCRMPASWRAAQARSSCRPDAATGAFGLVPAAAREAGSCSILYPIEPAPPRGAQAALGLASRSELMVKIGGVAPCAMPTQEREATSVALRQPVSLDTTSLAC